ncbi:centrosomal transforming acidic coiled-coil protein Alp7 [Schizosaccharomyces cryophilus OY26]|uniref:Centrosomal transforming acidic coiled-coil protein Alp7 n=1 Tax=Schizosaccharomyces cryophilus (strain OY26 / ATCC MYA-4695 / CBS 11777 / NBRC 106824 / NRRL Y48691) TaxID=653667 RepID=S9XG20_SCHCR|nr:centrosomal transforming acidic coiled-coil protein Alp7 [Schizosaccharomyces cryophilus OY26]EPY52596.1 centrosomal transforming acidic coiled-coil protein Alp7 [Schizosaccharomyces cryophilus OY26]
MNGMQEDQSVPHGYTSKEGTSYGQREPTSIRGTEDAMPAPRLYPKLSARPATTQYQFKESLNKRVNDRLHSLEMHRSSYDAPVTANSSASSYGSTPRQMRMHPPQIFQHKTPEFKHRKRNAESIITPKAPVSSAGTPVNNSSNTSTQAPRQPPPASYVPSSASSFSFHPPNSSSQSQFADQPAPHLTSANSIKNSNPDGSSLQVAQPVSRFAHAPPSSEVSVPSLPNSSDLPPEITLNISQKQQAALEAEVESYKAKLNGNQHEITSLQSSLAYLSGQLIAMNEQFQQLQTEHAVASSAKGTSQKLIEAQEEDKGSVSSFSSSSSTKRQTYTQEDVDKLLQERMEKVAEDLHAQYSAKHTQKISAFKVNYAKKYDFTIQELQQQVTAAAARSNIVDPSWELEKKTLQEDNDTLRKQLEKAIQEHQEMSALLENFKADMATSDRHLTQQQSEQTDNLNTLNFQIEALQEQLQIERDERKAVIQMSEELAQVIEKLGMKQT